MTKRFSVLFFSILTFMFTSVFAVNVTLNLDMENVTVSDDGVHVAGSFQGWDAGATALTDDDGDGVYTVTIDMSSVADDRFILNILMAMPGAVMKVYQILSVVELADLEVIDGWQYQVKIQPSTQFALVNV